MFLLGVAVVVVVVVVVVVEVVDVVEEVEVVVEVEPSMGFRQLELLMAAQPLHVTAAACTYTNNSRL